MRRDGIRQNQKLGWLAAGSLAVVTATWGIVDRDVYPGVIAPATAPGALSQDVITLLAGVCLCVLALTRMPLGPKREPVALGLFGYHFYGL